MLPASLWPRYVQNKRSQADPCISLPVGFLPFNFLPHSLARAKLMGLLHRRRCTSCPEMLFTARKMINIWRGSLVSCHLSLVMKLWRMQVSNAARQDLPAQELHFALEKGQIWCHRPHHGPSLTDQRRQVWCHSGPVSWLKHGRDGQRWTTSCPQIRHRGSKSKLQLQGWSFPFLL